VASPGSADLPEEVAKLNWQPGKNGTFQLRCNVVVFEPMMNVGVHDGAAAFILYSDIATLPLSRLVSVASKAFRPGRGRP
jgi:hypothetical protein